LTKSTNPRCISIRESLENNLSESESEEKNFGHGLAGDFPTSGGTFQVDFFGDSYTDADFGYDTDDSESKAARDEASGEGETDDDEDDPVAADQQAAVAAQGTWEPHRPLNPDGDDPDAVMEDAPAQGALWEPPPPSREMRTIAEDRFHSDPVIVKFPGIRAGEPISTSRATSAEEQYAAALDGASPLNPLITPNPYAPFSSKMDWEVARWAKLRGSGSTAFTDLLKIPGVDPFP
jgi:hypothetical protein